jgi:pimeloyl-ACP methyl ester carboxylesterase
VAKVGGLVAVLVALVGATVQGVLTSLERRGLARPGRMVDVGSHQLHVHCTGAGPTRVLLEAPLGSFSSYWTPVQTALDDRLAVCSYDRSGLGWSERGDGAFAPEQASRELDALVAQVGAAGPVVVVGDGFGAALAARFAREHADRVAALVLMAWPTASGPARRPSVRSPWLARIGLLRALDQRSGPRPAAESADDGSLEERAFGYRPDHLTRSAEEAQRWDEVMQTPLDGLAPHVAVRRIGVTRGSPDYVKAVLDAVLQASADAGRP